MKLVTAIIKPQLVDNVKEDLNKLGIRGLTATEVKGFGRQKGHTEFYRGSEFEVAFLPKTKLEVAVAEEKLEEVISTIRNSAKTGKFGDGKIFVTELDQVIRIRTGEKGPEAI
ncbi:MAG: transcriptional regulator [Candidatus Marinimicrobia bacterium]|jgi:nitrogen regulatory protein P-II 2|nr:transcriptional regulator [Candidatus Neomarinimicrobiota bacterium]